jgi:integrase
MKEGKKMATVRKRVLPSGEVRWLVDYRDQAGERRFKQFRTRAAAVAYETRVRGELVAGTHVPDSAAITVSEAAALWIQRAELDGLEYATVRQYRQHASHIKPLLGSKKLSSLSRPAVEAFKDALLKTRSRAMAKAILGSLKGIIKEAQRRGLAGHNVASDVQVKISKRHEEHVVIPAPEHIRALFAKAAEKWPLTTLETDCKTVACCWRPLIVTATLTGLRCSELRGLTWAHVDFGAGVIRVRQRADLRNNMGPPKSKAGRRDVPMSPMVANTLKAWKLACPVTKRDLVFPAQSGGIVTNGTIHRSCWGPLQRACGLVERVPRLHAVGAPVRDENGNPIIDEVPIYTFHSLRHAAASLFIEQGWSPKKLQSVMGHSTIQMTFDTYGHLWPSAEDDRTALAQIEARLGITG